MWETISDKLRDTEKIVFVTGAGISQESGIPTFRGKDG
ncbi:MAG TPA: NAD-dependent protein deacylase, partial [Candidatus Nitrosotalea sp.]|nr:NAD-dependent protein deacylase [Candidatus Nitrosotalea sp.]